MNRNILIATTIAAGAAAIYSVIRKKRKTAEQLHPVAAKRERHIVKAFSKAKHHNSL